MKLSIRKKYHRRYAYLASALCFFCTTQISSAEVVSYESMTSIPGLSGTGNLVEFINSAYVTLIAVGATWGVIKIAFAGFKYSLSEVVSSKSEALNDIKGVFAGLAVLLMPFVVLNTIYSPLTNLDVLTKLEKVIEVVPDVPQGRTSSIPQKRERMHTCPYDGQVNPLQALDTAVWTPNSDAVREEAKNMTQSDCETKLKSICGTSARIINDEVNKKVTCFYSEFTTGSAQETCDLNESDDEGTCRYFCTEMNGEITSFDEKRGLMTCTYPI